MGLRFQTSTPARDRPRKATLASPFLREWVPAFLTPYQRDGIATALAWPDESGMFVWSAGSGKTIASIIWGLADGSQVTVAVTKGAVRRQWAREVERYTLVPVVELEGRTPDLPKLPAPPYFLVLSYAVLPDWIEILEKLRPRSVIFDESHLVQSNKRWDPQIDLEDAPAPGKLVLIQGGEEAPTPPVKVSFTLKDNIAASAYRLSRVARRRLATTATPIRDRVRNLWAQLDLVTPWEWGTFYAFARRYCAAAENVWGGIDTRGSSNLDELKERLAFVSHRVSYSVANRDLPPKRRQVTYIPVKDQVPPTAIAEELRRATKMGSTALLEMRIMEAASRKRKIVSEYVVDALAGGLKIVVFTGRRRDVDALAETVKSKMRMAVGGSIVCPVFAGHGALSVEERDRLCADYMAAPAPAVLIGTGDAFGEGLNLQDTDLQLQPMLPYTPAQIIQREGRVARLGQKRPVLIHYFVCEGTVDEHVATILLNKLPAVEKALDLDEVKGLGRELIGASEEELLGSLLSKVLDAGS
jgi:superfamily II DNA or RNA helicase